MWCMCDVLERDCIWKLQILQRNLGSEIYFLEERIMKMTDVERIENDFFSFYDIWLKNPTYQEGNCVSDFNH